METEDELRELQALYDEGMLTSEEFAQAKADVLSESAGQPVPTQDGQPALPVGATRAQQELARLDQEWTLERETFMVTSRNGVRYLPSQGPGLVAAIGLGVIGVVWTIKAASSDMPEILIPIGILLFLVSVSMGIHRVFKARAYKRAEQTYQKRRATLLEQKDTGPQSSKFQIP
jgi:hypothetical protein